MRADERGNVEHRLKLCIPGCEAFLFKLLSILLCSQDKEEQWMTKLVPGANDFAMLQPLQWNTRYEVEITARNVKGLSEPTFYQFFMPQKPDITGKNMMKEK